jgi:hypothetical protein
MFAVAMMALLATSHVIQGMLVLLDENYFHVHPSGLAISVDFAAWGWAHLILSLMLWGVGMGLLAGRRWARILSVVLAGISAWVNMLFLPAFPTWSVLTILLDVLVIWALTVNGPQMTSDEVFRGRT